ncbi:hypothetical protein GCM10007304_07560 [Rhodococcoides trifolii]|uniref:DUF3349 domain-containing protein n=1 Tax=Rhodococcoides trifolii TaxID=908250 RepID=A0A917CS34_9NOCA|nr:DUF3349 domain-containing protein [Rhodococcus trifolii]GGF96089.1 hypothetical protein GCM10007304_07560 [Rhodococcus trifolii]
MAGGVINSIVQWLRAGYPNGVPEHDYVPLMALLSRRLSPGEVQELVDELARTGADKADIGAAITKVTDELPLDTDMDRVRSRLAAGGWPLADPFEPWKTSEQ